MLSRVARMCVLKEVFNHRGFRSLSIVAPQAPGERELSMRTLKLECRFKQLSNINIKPHKLLTEERGTRTLFLFFNIYIIPGRGLYAQCAGGLVLLVIGIVLVQDGG